MTTTEERATRLAPTTAMRAMFTLAMGFTHYRRLILARYLARWCTIGGTRSRKSWSKNFSSTVGGS